MAKNLPIGGYYSSFKVSISLLGGHAISIDVVNNLSMILIVAIALTTKV